MCANKLALNLSRFRLVTFDNTDTLIRFSSSPAIQYAKSAANFGYLDVDQRRLENSFKSVFGRMATEYPNFGLKAKGMDWKEWWRMLVINIFKESGENIPLDDLKLIAEQLIHRYRTEECWLKVDRADQIVSKIKALDKKVGVISNFDPSLHEILKVMKLPNFDFVLTSYEVGASKPDPIIFETARKLYNITEKESLHIGNTITADYFGALNAGWSSILITNSSDEWKNHAGVNKEHVFKNIASLLETLESKTISWK